MHRPLWYRYFFFRFLFFILFLSAICFSLFIIADLLSHIKDVVDPKTKWSCWGLYYLSMLSYRLDMLLPFSIACTTAIVLSRRIRNNELIPLLNAGLSLRAISRPFFAVSVLCSLKESLKESSNQLGIVLGKKGSRLFFAQHNKKLQELHDIFWVRSPDTVLHIEKLSYFSDRPPEGFYVDLIKRDSKGRMHKVTSYDSLELPELSLSQKELKMATANPHELSIFQLAYLVPRFGASQSERAIESSIALYQKSLFPLLALLAFLIPAPFCLRFEKKVPQAVLLFFSLAVLFSYLIIVQAFVVLVRAPICLPTLILLLPWAVAFLISRHRMASLT
jgi:lipopolysaccharide export system permease protein